MLILGNGRMITRDADNPYLECGAVMIDGTKIVKAGTLSEVKAAYPDAEFLDAKGKVVSGLAVCHLSVFNVDDGGLQILVQIMNDNFTGSSELFCNTMRHLL